MQIQNNFIDWLEKRIKNNLPGYPAQMQMAKNLTRPSALEAPQGAKESAVLVLLSGQADYTKVLLIQRTKDGGVHSGQIAFPGGKKEKEDKDLIATALREADEEVQIKRNDIVVLGPMSSLYIPVSNFIVQPVLAYCPALPSLEKSEVEVAKIIDMPLDVLFSSKRETEIDIYAPIKTKLEIAAYIPNENTIVWGATAMMLSELEALWREFF